MIVFDVFRNNAITERRYDAVSTGYLYIMGGGEDIYKIGISKNHPRYRVKQLQTGNPNIITLVKFYRRKDYQELETRLHRRFHKQRVSGEWFNVKLEDIIKEIEGTHMAAINKVFRGFIELLAWVWSLSLTLFVITIGIIALEALFGNGTIIRFLLDIIYKLVY